jgi:hypothetical protein
MAIEFRIKPIVGSRKPKTSFSLCTVRRIVDPREGKSGMTYIRYLPHEASCFVDEQSTPFSIQAYQNKSEKMVRKAFSDGLLIAEEYDTGLIEFLRHCPENVATPKAKGVDKIFYEVDREAFAANSISIMDKISEAQDLIIGMTTEQLQIVCMTLGVTLGSTTQMLYDLRRLCMTKYDQIIKIAKDANMDVKSKLMLAMTLNVIKKQKSRVVWGDSENVLVPILPGDDALEVMVGFFNLPQNRPQYEALCLKLDLHTPSKKNKAEITNADIEEVDNADVVDIIREAIVLNIVEKKSLGWINFNGIKIGKEKDLKEFAANPDNEQIIADIKAAVLLKRTT